MVNVLLNTAKGSRCRWFASSKNISDVCEKIGAFYSDEDGYITTAGGVFVDKDDCLSNLVGPQDDMLVLCVRYRLNGGKGGFGSQLRAAGGRMSSRKGKQKQNQSSMRDSDGRRVRVVKQTQELAKFLTEMPSKKRALAREKREKLEAIIDIPLPSEAHPKFADQEYLRNSELMLDEVRNAVSDALASSNHAQASSSAEESNTQKSSQSVKLSGWDQEDSDLSDSSSS